MQGVSWGDPTFAILGATKNLLGNSLMIGKSTQNQTALRSNSKSGIYPPGEVT